MAYARSSVDTPLMRQYLEVKERYPDCLIFFRVGDFYEMFFDDAVTAARAIDLTLTTRDKGKEDPVPMCGVPYHAARLYLGKLIEQGFKVAVCDQVEDPRQAKGLVKRDVIQVVTPGVLLDEDQLDARRGCYLVALVAPDAPDPLDALEKEPEPELRRAGEGTGAGIDRGVPRGKAKNPAPSPRSEPRVIGLAMLDVSTGEFALTEIAELDLDDELARIGPRELLLAAGALPELRARTKLPITELPVGKTPVTGSAHTDTLRTETQRAAQHGAVRRGAIALAEEAADRALLEDALGLPLSELGPDLAPGKWWRAVAAAAACIRYARITQPAGTLPLTRLVPYRAADHLLLDCATQAHLELFETLAERKRRGSLLGLLDETKTSPGARLLRRWIGAPLVDVAAIRRRHDGVEWLVEHAALRATLRAELAAVYDMERLAGRVTLGVASPRDLVSLRRSLERLPVLALALSEAAGNELAPPDLLRLGTGVPDSTWSDPADPGARTALALDVAEDIAATLVDDPPALWKEGHIIRRGHRPELDEFVDLASGGKNHILDIELRERERSGIASLKVRYNKVFGYYLEITRSNLARVPADYVRKQTLANAERYITSELAEYEARVLGAEEKRVALEEELFIALRRRVAAHARRIQALAEQVAVLDVLCALAEVAHTSSYARPEVDAGGRIEIDDGRHPVVERLASPESGFVPNDVRLDPDDAQLLVITGPNMAGKSTVMRQVALIVVLAQAGSFVPARRARIGVVDRVFTRVGASDNLSRGESTFMMEMRETAAILRHATRRSLVVLDEIGRGTSTYDGLSIAWAVAEHLHDRVGAKTLFATHYHELCALARTRPRVRNLHVAVREWKDSIVFLHKLVEGGASRSYGIQVARLAGLPKSVLDRARDVLAGLERGDEGVLAPLSPSPQLALFGAPVAPAPAAGADQDVLERLRDADVDELSPRAAHALLAELHARLRPPPVRKN